MDDHRTSRVARLLALASGQRLFASALVSQVFASGGNFAVNILLAGALGPHLFGYWALGWIVVAVLTAFHYVLVQIPAQILSRADDGSVDQDCLVGISLLALAYAAGAGIIAGLAGVAGAAWLDMPTWLGVGLGPFACGWMLVEYNRRALIVAGKLGLLNLLEGARALLSIGLVLLCIRGATDLTLLGAATWGLAALTLLLAAIGLVAIIQGTQLSAAAFWATAGRTWHYSRWMVPTALSSRLGPDAGLAMASVLLGPAAVGGFRAMFQITSVLNLLYQAIVVVLPVKYVELHRKYGNARLYQVTRQLSLLFVLLGLVLLAFFALFGRPVVSALVGPKYLEYSVLLPWLSLMYVAILLHNPLSSWLHALGASDQLLLPNLAGVGASLLIVIPLLHLFGIVGLAIALLCLYIIEVSGLALALRRRICLDSARTYREGKA